MQVYMRRYFSAIVTDGLDRGMFSFPLPSESVLNYLKGEVHVFNESSVGPINIDGVGMFGMEGWILQSDDMTTDFASMDTLWDTSVPKADGVQTLDESWTADTDGMYEPGLLRINQIFDVEIGGPERIYQMEKILTRVNSGFGMVPSPDGETTPSTVWLGTLVPVNIKKKYMAKEDSGVIFGIGSPDFTESADDNVYPVGGSLSIGDARFALKYLAQFIDKAVFDFLGLTEVGAETPYDDALTFLTNILEKVHSTQDLDGSIHWQYSGKATGGIRVPGRMGESTIGPDMQAG